MRRYLFLTLFLTVLVTPFLLRQVVGTDPENRSHRGAARTVVIVTPHAEGIRREFQEGFSAWLKARGEPDVFLDYRNFGSGASDIVKYFESSRDLYASTGSYGVDMVWGGGEDLFDRQLKRPGFLQAVALPADLMSAAYPTPDIGGVGLYDKDGFWFGSALGSFGIVYNKDVLRHLGLAEPRTWADLADPRYRNWLVLADPTRSSSARTAFMAVIERAMADAEERKTSPDDGWADGMGLIRRVCANCRSFADASAAVPAMIGRGDAAAGMAIDFYGRTLAESVGGDRIAYVEPAGATVVNPDPIAVVAGARNRAAAVRFVEYVLSEPGQRLWNQRPGTPGGPRSTALRRLPIRRSVYADTRHFADRVNPFAVAGSFNTRKTRTGTFQVLGELIQVSCLDLLPELRETRAAILASPRAAELDARLGRFPFGQREAIKRFQAYQGPKENPSKPLERLRLLREWTGEFKAEYQQLREAAR